MLTQLVRLFKNYTIQRGLVAAFMFAASIYLAWLLGAEFYGEVAFVMLLIKFLHIGQLGSVSGYIYNFYNKDKVLQEFQTFYFVHLLLVSIIVLIFLGLLGSLYIFAALFFLMLVPIYSLEPYFRTKRLFFISLIPDSLITLSIVIVTTYFYFASFLDINGRIVLLYSIGVLFVFFVFQILLLYKYFPLRPKNINVKLRNYISIVKTGMPLFLGSLSFILLMFIDRLFIERFFDNVALSVYMLGFQLATGASLIISSQNFVNGISIGEAVKSIKGIRELLSVKLKNAIKVGLLSYLGLGVFSFLLEKIFLKEYEGLIVFSLIIGIGLIFFYIAGSISPIIFYKGNQKKLSFMLLIVTLSVFIKDIIIMLYSLPVILIPLLTSILLIIYSLYCLVIAWRTSSKI